MASSRSEQRIWRDNGPPSECYSVRVRCYNYKRLARARREPERDAARPLPDLRSGANDQHPRDHVGHRTRSRSPRPPRPEGAVRRPRAHLGRRGTDAECRHRARRTLPAVGYLRDDLRAVRRARGCRVVFRSAADDAATSLGSADLVAKARYEHSVQRLGLVEGHVRSQPGEPYDSLPFNSTHGECAFEKKRATSITEGRSSTSTRTARTARRRHRVRGVSGMPVLSPHPAGGLHGGRAQRRGCRNARGAVHSQRPRAQLVSPVRVRTLRR